MQDDQLERAIKLVNSGKIDDARTELELLIKEDRKNIAAWHWYAETWPKASDKIRVWEACLRYNPGDTLAIQSLDDLSPTLLRQIKPTKSATVTPKRRSCLSMFLWGIIGSLVLVALFIWGLADSYLPKNSEKYKHTEPVEYYLYVPRAYSPEKEWPLFIGIHGAGGDGLECWYLWQRFAEKEGFILLCPTIPGNANGYRQDIGEKTTWSAITEIKKDYHIQQRMFLSGFSAGGIFIQGFAAHYPGYVSGLSILSAGMYIEPATFSEYVPMLIVIGGKDDPFAVKTSVVFTSRLQEAGFDVDYVLLPEIDHAITPTGIDLTIDLFKKTIGQ